MFAVLVSSAPIGMLCVGIAARSWSVAYVCDVGSCVFLIAAATIAVRGGVLETFSQQTITSLE
jgi:hypothetical protein